MPVLVGLSELAFLKLGQMQVMVDDAMCSGVPCTKGHVINLDYCNVNLLTAIMLGGAYDRDGASLVVLQGHAICCSRR